MKEFDSYHAEETFALGERLGQSAKAGQVYCLYGDLGAGKTVFTQGFAKGMGISEWVNSPTFTIVKLYESASLILYHFDVYRIEDEAEMEEIGYEEYFYGDGVCLVEWPGNVSGLLPEHYTCVTIKKDLEKGFDYRHITIGDNSEMLELEQK